MSRSSITHSISQQAAWEEYRANPDFRALVQSGSFIYVNPHYVYNQPQYVKASAKGGVLLTDHARRNLEECTLVFAQAAQTQAWGDEQDQANHKVGARFEHFRLSQQKYFSKELIDLMEAIITRFKNEKARVRTSWSKIFEYLQEEESNSYDFSDRTLLNVSFYTKAKQGHAIPPSFHVIMSIVAGYDWDLDRATEVLALAGHCFSPVIEQHAAYLFVINSMIGCTIYEKNIFLEAEGVKPFGSKVK